MKFFLLSMILVLLLLSSVVAIPTGKNILLLKLTSTTDALTTHLATTSLPSVVSATKTSIDNTKFDELESVLTDEGYTVTSLDFVNGETKLSNLNINDYSQTWILELDPTNYEFREKEKELLYNFYNKTHSILFLPNEKMWSSGCQFGPFSYSWSNQINDALTYLFDKINETKVFSPNTTIRIEPTIDTNSWYCGDTGTYTYGRILPNNPLTKTTRIFTFNNKISKQVSKNLEEIYTRGEPAKQFGPESGEPDLIFIGNITPVIANANLTIKKKIELPNDKAYCSEYIWDPQEKKCYYLKTIYSGPLPNLIALDNTPYKNNWLGKIAVDKTWYRFTNENINKGDTTQYVQNLANWLEPSPKVYEPSCITQAGEFAWRNEDKDILTLDDNCCTQENLGHIVIRETTTGSTRKFLCGEVRT